MSRNDPFKDMFAFHETLAGPTLQYQEMLTGIHEALMPKGMYSWAENLRGLQEALVPHTALNGWEAPLTTANAVTVASRNLHDSFAEVAKGAAGLNANFAAAFGARHEFSSFDAMVASVASLEGLGLGKSVLRCFRVFDELEKTLCPLLTEPTFDVVGRHFRQLATPSLSFLATPWERPLGLLSAIEGSGGASLTWLRGGGKTPRLAVAAMIEPPSPDQECDTFVDAHVVCLLCHEPLLLKNGRFKRIGRTRGIRTIEAAPICMPCLRTDPENYLRRILEVLEGRRDPIYKFEIIKGEGQGTGRPNGRSHIRLVQSQSRSSDDEPEDAGTDPEP
jgi:hypothetical protein